MKLIHGFSLIILLSAALGLSGCGGSSSSTSSSPVPTISSLSPSSVTAGGAAFTLTVNGSNFVSASDVQWNGSARTTSYVSATKITAQISAADIVAAGSASITVANPGAGGGTSSAVKLTINSAPAQGSLSVTIMGLPAGSEASVTVTGPNGYASQLTSSQTLQVAPGAYAVVGNPVGVGNSTYYPATAAQTATVSNAATASVTVNYSTIIPNTTKVLDTAGIDSLTVSPDGSTITISTSSAVANSLAAGDVLASAPASAAPNGMLVKILSVSTSGQTVTASVQQATLEEAIQQGTIQFTETLGPENTTPNVARRRKSLSRSARGGLRLKSLASVSGACTGNPNTIPVPLDLEVGGSATLEGEADFCPTFNFSLQITAFKLVSANATVTLGSDLSLNLTDENGQGSLTKNLTGFEGPQTTVLIGGVPFEVQPTLTPYIGLSFPVYVGSASAYTGVTLASTLTVGTSYANGSWNPIGQASSSASPAGATSVDGQVNVKALAGVQAGVLLDGLVTSFLSSDGYLQFIANPTANPCWNLNAGLEANVGVQADILGIGLGYTSPPLNLYSATVAQATNTCTPILSGVNPNMALAMSPDTTIALSGSNFVPDSVANFNGQPLSTTFVDPNDLTAIVPSSDLVNGGTFPVTVTNPDNSATSNPVIFTVSAVPVTIAPRSASVPVEKNQQFAATVQGSSNTGVLWSVNGSIGGNSIVGTISAEGLYTAPSTVPNPATVSVTAASQAESSISASASVTVTTLSYTFTTIDYPGAVSTDAYGINNNGEIVGTYEDSNGNSRSFLYSNGTFTTINYPGAVVTDAYGINDSGQIVGWYNDSSGNLNGFLYTNGNFSAIDDPSADAVAGGTLANGINDSGQIAGWYTNNANVGGGFLYSDGNFTRIYYPGAINDLCSANGINDNGQIVGTYTNSTGGPYGFLYSDGNFTTINYPATTENYLDGINDSGQIVGTFDDSNGEHGFLATPSQ